MEKLKDKLIQITAVLVALFFVFLSALPYILAVILMWLLIKMLW